MHYSNLWVSITQPSRRTSSYYCKPYRFLITTNACSYIAFTTWRGLKTWLRDNNLKLGPRNPRGGRSIIGAVQYVFTPVLPGNAARYSHCLHNGDYVPCAYEYRDGLTVKHVTHTGLASNRQSLNEYREKEAIYG